MLKKNLLFYTWCEINLKFFKVEKNITTSHVTLKMTSFSIKIDSTPEEGGTIKLIKKFKDKCLHAFYLF